MNSESESSLDTDQFTENITGTKKRTKGSRARARSGSTTSKTDCDPSDNPQSEVITVKQVTSNQGSLSFDSFYLFFAGTCLLTVSCTLLSSGVWCLLVRLPLIHMVHGPTSILVALTSYMAAAGAITFPASCILYKHHNVTHRRPPLLPVIVLLSICTIFLTCCAGHAIVYRKSAYADLEDSATSSARLQCCGMDSSIEDQTRNSTTPASPWTCRISSPDEGDNNYGKKRNAPLPGCLDAITLDLMWITTYILGLCFIAIFADVLVILSIGIFLRRLDWKNE